MKLEKMLDAQKRFSKKFYDIDCMTEKEIVEKHKTLCLSMQSALSRLADCVDYREHRRDDKKKTNRENILFETLDVYRYCLAQFNLWGFNAREIEQSYFLRDEQLSSKLTKNLSNWSGQQIIVVDVDDVLAKFRHQFYNWLNDNFDANVDESSKEYFATKTVNGKSVNELYSLFIEEGNMLKLQHFDNTVKQINQLQSDGYWIHILTARPEHDLRCRNETYCWLNQIIKYDSVQFATEKYSSLTNLQAFKTGKILCAIDDSSKHAMEYAMHGITCFVPRKTYNAGLEQSDKLILFDQESESVYELVTNKFKKE